MVFFGEMLSSKLKLLALTVFIVFVLTLLIHYANIQLPFGGFYIQTLIFVIIAIAAYLLLTRIPRN